MIHPKRIFFDLKLLYVLGRFCTVLDGSKSGLVVKASVKANDHGQWGHLVFDQRGESFQGYTMYDQKPRVPAQRPRNLGPDIIDKFHSIGKDFLVGFNVLTC